MSVATAGTEGTINKLVSIEIAFRYEPEIIFPISHKTESAISLISALISPVKNSIMLKAVTISNTYSILPGVFPKTLTSIPTTKFSTPISSLNKVISNSSENFLLQLNF